MLFVFKCFFGMFDFYVSVQSQLQLVPQFLSNLVVILLLNGFFLFFIHMKMELKTSSSLK